MDGSSPLDSGRNWPDSPVCPWQLRSIHRLATGRNVLERVAWSVEQQQAGPEDPLVRDEAIERVQAAIGELPAEQGRVVRMRIYEEKTFAVIAEELKIPLGTALGRMRTALMKLKKLLEDE